MKLYIDSYHYNPNRLKIHLLKNKFTHDKFMSVEFYTNNGIYTIENNEMYKLVPMDNPIELVNNKIKPVNVDHLNWIIHRH